MKPIDAALQLIGLYVGAHPELNLKEGIQVATLLEGGVGLQGTDDDAGGYVVRDASGNELVRLDLSAWIPAKEGG